MAMDGPKMTVSARLDESLASELEKMARVRGVTRSVLVEQLLGTAVESRRTFTTPDGVVTMRRIGEINVKRGVEKPIDIDHPAIQLWECEGNIWPRHFLHVFAEFDEDGEGSSECWYRWRGSKLEEFDPYELGRKSDNG
ncbi:MAG TPA: ribbon-helix-helix domain-containing protein [Phycisphaerales bacterium]|nr:ribbon-helix-helix domain-containing protein [Phycisphaerales bacterium]